MINVTEKFIQLLNANSRTFRMKLVNGSEEYTNILNLKWFAALPSYLSIGNALCTCVECKAVGIPISIKGTYLDVYITVIGSDEWVQIGTFKAEKPTLQNGVVSFSAYDVMNECSKAIFAHKLGTVTIGECYETVIADIESEIGTVSYVPLPSSVASHKINADLLIGYDCRNVLAYIAGYLGCNCVVNNTGAIEMRGFTVCDYTLNDNRIAEPELDDNVSDLEFLACSVNSDTKLLYGNNGEGFEFICPIMTQERLNQIGATLCASTSAVNVYRSGKINHLLGDLRLQIGDVVSLEHNGETHTIPLSSIAFEFDGGLSADIEALPLAEASALSLSDTLDFISKQNVNKRITGITNYYLAASEAEGVTKDMLGWTDTIQKVTDDKKYLWNYECVTLADGTSYETGPCIIGNFAENGSNGRGIKSITEYYLVTQTESTPSKTNFNQNVQTPTETLPFLWNYEKIEYTDDSTPYESDVRLIGVYGSDGKGVSKVETWYYLSTSETALVGGSWSTSAPTWTDGTYLWTKLVTTYTDGDTKESAPVVDASWKKTTTVEAASKELNETLANALGLYVTELTVSGSKIRYYHTNPILAASESGDTILVLNARGFGICKSGWNGGSPDFSYGATFDGKAVWDILSANKISADLIEAGIIKSLDSAPIETEFSLNTGLFTLDSKSKKERFGFGTNAYNNLMLQYSYSDSEKRGIKVGFYYKGRFYKDSNYSEVVPWSTEFYYGDLPSGDFFEFFADGHAEIVTDLTDVSKTYKGFVMHSVGATVGYEVNDTPDIFGNYITSDFTVPNSFKGDILGVYKEIESQPKARTPILKYYDYELEASEANPHLTEIRKQSISTKYLGAEKIAFNFDGRPIDLEATLKEFARAINNNSSLDLPFVTPQMYGAKGDGKTDDTEAFKAALAENRLVFVPEGTYKLSGELIVAQNCGLELSQATHLKFTQTLGNCIELRSSATLKGNHGVIEVPYGFTGNVISADTLFDESTTDTPPFRHYDPMWKRARYIYDVCIVKPNSAGLHCSIDGKCSGTGIYLSAKGKHLTEGDINFIWGAMLQGVRIAGGFTYGIQVENIDDPNDNMEDDAWNHDMRIEAVIQGCETGVSLFNCNLAHLSVTIQPSTADGSDTYRYTKYAKWGVRLEDCKGIDMTSCFIWDWHAARDDSEEYTHIAMYGNCTGLVLGDYLYHANASTDIRKQIYSDRPSNLEKMTVLQEPITRWFKPIGNAPYFANGKEDKELLLKEDFDICFEVDVVPNFTDELAKARDLNGNIYNGIGYEVGVGYIASNGVDEDSEYYGRTGFIKCKTGSIIRVEGIKITPDDGWSGVLLYTSNKGLRDGGWISSYNLLNNSKYYYTDSYTETENGFSFRIVATDVEYVRFTTKKGDFDSEPVVAVDEEISYSQAGFLADSIKVNAENVIGLPESSVDVTDEMVKEFDDVIPQAVDTDKKTIFNEIGYIKSGCGIDSSGATSLKETQCGCTGYIPVVPGKTIYVEGINVGAGSTSSLFVLTDANLTKIASYLSTNSDFRGNGYFMKYRATDDGFKIYIEPDASPNAAYLRFSFLTEWLSNEVPLMAAIDEEVDYHYAGFLADSIKVKGENVTLQSPDGKLFKLVVNNDGTLSTTAQ